MRIRVQATSGRSRPPVPRWVLSVDRTERELPRICLVVGALLLVIGQSAVGVATLALGAVVFGFKRASRFYDAYWPPSSDDPAQEAKDFTSLAAAVRTEAAALVTVAGVALTLIFTFLGSQPASLAVKVAAVALVLALCLGLLLCSMVAIGIASRTQRSFAYLIFCWTIWASAFGLLCLTSAVVVER